MAQRTLLHPAREVMDLVLDFNGEAAKPVGAFTAAYRARYVAMLHQPLLSAD